MTNRRHEKMDKPRSGSPNNWIRGNGLYKFAKRHYKWIAVVGGVIVSVTLTLKDQIRERDKDYASAVENAETFQRIKALNESISSKLDVLIQDINLARHKGISNTDLQQEVAAEMGQEFYSNYGALSLKLDSAGALIEIADSPELKARLQTLTANAKKVSAREEMVPEELITTDAVEIEHKRFDDLRELRNISERVERLSEDTMRVLEEQKQLRYRLYRMYSIISYGIIALGFVLTLSAKAFDRPGGATEIDSV